MIHGQRKGKKQKTAEELAQQQSRSEKISTKLKEFFAIRNKQLKADKIPTLLEFTAILMQLCSDISTIFNYRREILLYLIQNQKEPKQKLQILGDDLKLNTKIIMQDTKSYTLWSHRQWLIQKLFTYDPSITDKQRQLIKKLLQKDQKNFHAWNYRSWINSISMNLQAQLQFTKEKIKQNPFNFSPYHFRSRYLKIKYSNYQLQKEDIILYGLPKSVLLQELQSVQTAIFLNPQEEAPWNYYNSIIQQMIPTILLKDQILPSNQRKLTFSINITSPASLIHPDTTTYHIINPNQGTFSNIWIVESKQQWKLLSTLNIQSDIKFQGACRFLVGSQKKTQQISKIRQLLNSHIKFVYQVIESQENKCRFGWLQLLQINKALLMCGCNKQSYNNIVKQCLGIFIKLKDEKKNQKYVQKIKTYWESLTAQQDNSLSIPQRQLKYYDS